MINVTDFKVRYHGIAFSGIDIKIDGVPTWCILDWRKDKRHLIVRWKEGGPRVLYLDDYENMEGATGEIGDLRRFIELYLEKAEKWVDDPPTAADPMPLQYEMKAQRLHSEKNR